MANDVNIKINIQAARAKAQVAEFDARVQRAALSVQKLSTQNKILDKRLDKVASRAKRATSTFTKLSGAVSIFVGNLAANAASSAFGFIIKGFKSTVDAMLDFEKGLIAVDKTTNLSRRGIKELGDAIRKLSTQIPTSSTNLLKLATVAGQLGFDGKKDILAFAETLGKLEIATDIVGEQGAQAVARILNLTNELGEGDAPANINAFGNVITELGNNFAVTESQILRVANEVAKGGAAFNLASEDVLALATAFAATGSRAEISGSTIQKIFVEIGKAADKGGVKLEQFALAAGKSTEEFRQLFQDNPTEGFKQLVKGLNQAKLSGGQLANVLSTLGLNDKRLIRSLTPLIQRFDLLEESMERAKNEASKTSGALDEELRKKTESLGGQLIILNNNVVALQTTLGQNLSPVLRDVVADLNDFIAAGFSAENVFKGLANAAVGAGPSIANYAAGLLNAEKETEDLSGKLSTLTDDTKNYVEIQDEATDSLSGFSLVIDQSTTSLQEHQKELISLSEAREEAVVAAENGKKLAEEIVKIEERDIARKKAAAEAARAELAAQRDLRNAEAQLVLEKEEERIFQAGEVQIFQEERLIALEQFFEREQQIELQARINSATNETERQRLIVEAETIGFKNRQDLRKKAFDIETKNREKRAKDEIAFAKKKDEFLLRGAAGTLGGLASISRLGGKKNFELTKGFALAEATINGILSVTQAISTPPGPPITIPLGIAAGVQSAARIASIAATSAGGFQDGGVVPGTSFSGDNVSARVNSGEMILNRQQQRNLFEIANQRPENNDQPIQVNTEVILDGETIARAVSVQVANGFELGEVV